MMFKLLIYLYLTILCGCGLEYRDNSTIFGHISNHQKRVLPESFVECNHAFYFSTNRFLETGFLSGPISIGPNTINVVSEPTTKGPYKSGWRHITTSSGNGKENFSVCREIYQNLEGGVMTENSLYQYFDRAEVANIVNSYPDFEDIQERMAALMMDRYEYPKDSDKLKHLSLTVIRTSVNCEEKWQVKRHPEYPTKAIFKEPNGRCHFYTRDYQFTLLSGRKVVVAINGFYEKDSELDNERIRVEISRFGFMYVD
jgi:hypothetical protein